MPLSDAPATGTGAATVERAPAVSVVIPCYNMGAFLGAAIDSVLAQTFRDFEIVVVDDGSNDPATLAKLKEIEAQGVRVLSAANGGVAAARNRGIAAARGKYILPLDADDLIEPGYLEKGVRILEERPEVAVVTCDAERFGADSGIVRLPPFSQERLLSENLLFVTSLFRRSDWERVGGFCSAFRFGWEDWDFWISLTNGGGKVVRIDQPLLKYRIRRDSRDRSMTVRQKAAMLLLLLARHPKSYLRHPTSLLKLIANSGPLSDGKRD